MTDRFDAQTGRRIYTAVERLQGHKANLERLQRRLADFEWEAALTLGQLLKPSIITLSISAPVATASIWTANAFYMPVAGPLLLFLGTIAAVTVILSVLSLLERIDYFRTGAATNLRTCQADIADTERAIENLEQEITTVRRLQEERVEKDAAEPSPVELLEVIVSTASRNAEITERDAILWAIVAEDPADEETWAAIAASNGWSSELLAKVRGVRRPAIGRVPQEPEVNTAGWAG
ncbi:hypothetical protein [Glaciihabitans sp. INWT7]|uniref:hypothetical protein n=1 Tax=Glaciihabitans sp. INWT7 TaxID=2596912 RepID=UPI001CA50246|nr:hypothetical protein [Glaciihabitans sp. INWT7]